MNSLPPFVYALAFWEAVSWLVAGVLALLAFFGVLGPEWALSAAAVLSFIKAILRWFKIEPELRFKELELELRALKAALVTNQKPAKLQKSK